jgi:hypothetical protein
LTGESHGVLRRRQEAGMAEVVYDTNQLIDFAKKGKLDVSGFTTIFNIIDYPKAGI